MGARKVILKDSEQAVSMSTKQKQTPDPENKLVVAKGGRGGRMERELGINKLIYNM